MWMHVIYDQACKLKFRLKELYSCLCSAAASAVCFEGCLIGLDRTETRNELSQPKIYFTPLFMGENLIHPLTSTHMNEAPRNKI